MAFGIPVATANLLSWSLLNIDNIVIARMLGTTALGYYVLAFNISNWPMSAIGQVVRSIALPAFAQSLGGHDRQTLARALALAWAASLPVGALLAVLSFQLITLVYGGRWAPSAPVLAALGLFGAIRVVFDLCVAYLLSRGASAAVLRVQAAWFVSLVPTTIAGAYWFGIVGAAWAHVVVAAAVILPSYLWVVRRQDADFRAILVALAPPSAPCSQRRTCLPPRDPLAPCLVGHPARGWLDRAHLNGAVLFRWLRRLWRQTREVDMQSEGHEPLKRSLDCPAPVSDQTRGARPSGRDTVPIRASRGLAPCVGRT